ncbi:hypothetical protein BDQ17DRAFT_1242964, partial [Cyathus striatus]
IADMDGPIVANTFYEHLFKEDPKKPNMDLAAEAVHLASAELRRQGVDFEHWVPFIYLGK